MLEEAGEWRRRRVIWAQWSGSLGREGDAAQELRRGEREALAEVEIVAEDVLSASFIGSRDRGVSLYTFTQSALDTRSWLNY